MVCHKRAVWCCVHLQTGETIALVAGQLSVDEFGEEKLSELWTLNASHAHIVSVFRLRSDCRRSRAPLTFLNTAGFGRGGPKGGTSSRAVTDICQSQSLLLKHECDLDRAGNGLQRGDGSESHDHSAHIARDCQRQCHRNQSAELISCHLVAGAVRARLLHLHQDEGV